MAKREEEELYKRFQSNLLFNLGMVSVEGEGAEHAHLVQKLQLSLGIMSVVVCMGDFHHITFIEPAKNC